jgi:hypothetical protein
LLPKQEESERTASREGTLIQRLIVHCWFIGGDFTSSIEAIPTPAVGTAKLTRIVVCRGGSGVTEEADDAAVGAEDWRHEVCGLPNT